MPKPTKEAMMTGQRLIVSIMNILNYNKSSLP
jgi:hypothetical protein